jgi:hypothetical protein
MALDFASVIQAIETCILSNQRREFNSQILRAPALPFDLFPTLTRRRFTDVMSAAIDIRTCMEGESHALSIA